MGPSDVLQQGRGQLVATWHVTTTLGSPKDAPQQLLTSPVIDAGIKQRAPAGSGVWCGTAGHIVCLWRQVGRRLDANLQ